MAGTAVATNTGADPITALLTRDWASLGGWSLAIGMGIFLIVGYTREWLVPGARYRRLEESAQKQSETLATNADNLKTSLQANEIVSYFFQETAPRRGEVNKDVSPSDKAPTS